MQITPLVLHAGLILPRYTTRFSDALPVSSITVAEGGDITVTCAAPHGCPVGQQMAINITDADIPNPITDVDVGADGTLLITTEHPHDLTTTPDANRFQAWHTTVKLAGFSNALINGTRQLDDVADSTSFIMTPGGTVASVTLTGNEVLLERLEAEVIGWHAATATSPTVLTIPTPASVTRDFTVANPTVVTSIRVFGAVNLDAALMQFSPEGDDGYSLDKAHMFICPMSTVRASRSSASRTDGVADINPSADMRQILLDGFQINVFLPGGTTVAHVQAVDLCQGDLLRAINKTFYGLKVPRPEFSDPTGSFAALLESHTGGITKDRAIYIHQYEFQAQAVITNDDAVSPWEWIAIAPAEYAAAQENLAAGGTLPDSLATIPATGTVSFRGLDFTGILHDGKPQPLTANIDTDF